MARTASLLLHVRISPSDAKHLKKIRECGDWDNDSAAVRFCIDFTTALLAVLPATLAESFVQASQEENGGAGAETGTQEEIKTPDPLPSREIDISLAR